MRLRSWPVSVFHPFLFALYPLLLLYSRNSNSVYFSESLGAILVVLLATLIFWTTTGFLWNDATKSGLLTSSALFVTFSFERNVHTAKLRGIGASNDFREWLILGVGLMAVCGWVALLQGVPKLVRTLNTVANAASVALLAFLTPGLFQSIRASSPTRSAQIGGTQGEFKAIHRDGRTSGQDPDIYFIVLDAYGRSDILKSMYDYDNRPFVERMERRGFHAARGSTSNYCQTALSIPATLGGEYHDRIAEPTSKSRLPLRDLIRDNPTLNFLKLRGYKLVSFASGFGLTDGFPGDERHAPSFDLSEFNGLLLNMTPFWTILGEGSGRASHRRHRERILNVFDHLAEVADDPDSTFCLAHIVAPHPPFVFDREGLDISAENTSYRLADGKHWSDLDGHGGPEAYAKRYRDQATYLSRRVEQLVDQVIARSSSPPVIVIQGDHGPASHFDPDNARPNDLAERMSILNLCLIPGGGERRLYPSITPVNTFRVVCDHLFGTNRGLLPDRNYYSSYLLPYRFVEVTGRLDSGPSEGGSGSTLQSRRLEASP